MSNKKGIIKKMKKAAALILCIFMLILIVSGCVKEELNPGEETTPVSQTPTGDVSPSNEPSTEPSTGNEPEDIIHLNIIDFEAAFKTFAPDAVMIKLGDYSVTWDELYFQLYGIVNSYLNSLGGESLNWSEIYYDMTIADAVLDYATENIVMYKIIEYAAKTTSVALSPEDIEILHDDWNKAVERYGSEEEFKKYLWETYGFSSLELFKYITTTSYLAKNLQNSLYGENGELLPEEDMAEFTAADGFLMAKHILCFIPQEGEDTAKDTIELVFEQLNNYTGSDFDTFFDKLMYQYSEDEGGLQDFPDGYLFQYGDMVPSFYEGCLALEIGKYSGVIESEYGYHIIYRLPIDYDEVPYANYAQYDYRTLRQMISQIMFEDKLFGWRDELEIEYTDKYNSIDVAEIFKTSD